MKKDKVINVFYKIYLTYNMCIKYLYIYIFI